MEDLGFALKYQFTDEAKKVIEGVALSRRIIELGTERIIKALKGESTAKILLSEAEIKEDIASFAAARMILGTLKNQFVTNRFAVNESKIVRSHLNKEKKEVLDRVAARFDINTKEHDGSLLVDIPTYLRCSPRSQPYRLVNRRIFNGFVEIKTNEKNRLIEEAIRKHIETIPVVKNPPEEMKEAGEKIFSNLPKTEVRIEVKEGDHPPCVMKLLEEMKKHQNLNHNSRWYLATYLLAIGKTEDEITGLYSDLPDFNEKTTRYQISHARKKGYSVPSCATLMSYGICCAVCRIGTPIRWHKLDQKRKEELLK